MILKYNIVPMPQDLCARKLEMGCRCTYDVAVEMLRGLTTGKRTRVVARVQRCAGWSCERLGRSYDYQRLAWCRVRSPLSCRYCVAIVPDLLSESGVVRRSKFHHSCEVGTVRCGNTTEVFWQR